MPSPPTIVVHAPPIDWWTRAGVIATVVAALLALAAIIYAGCLAEKGRRQLIADRRATYDLGVLTALAEVWITGAQRSQERITALLHALPGDDLPKLRAMYGIRSSAESGQALLTLTHARLDDPSITWPNPDWLSPAQRKHLEELKPDEVGAGSVRILWQVPPLKDEITDEIISTIDRCLRTSD